MEYTIFGGPDGPQVSTLALGAMMFGTTIDEPASFAILDRFREAGGTFLDTADCYAFWIDGRHRPRERGAARTLAGGPRLPRRDGDLHQARRPAGPGARTDLAAQRRGALGTGRPRSRGRQPGRLGTDHVEVLFSHIEDQSVTFDETAGAFAELIAEGKVAVAGVSNHPTSRMKRARAAADELGVPGYTAVQQRHGYLRALPGASFSSPQEPADDELLAMVRAGELSMMAYSTLLEGALVREDRPLARQYQSPENELRRQGPVARRRGGRRDAHAAGAGLAAEGEPAIVPVLGVSSVAQLDDGLGAVDVPRDAVRALAEAALAALSH